MKETLAKATILTLIGSVIGGLSGLLPTTAWWSGPVWLVTRGIAGVAIILGIALFLQWRQERRWYR